MAYAFSVRSKMTPEEEKRILREKIWRQMAEQKIMHARMPEVYVKIVRTLKLFLQRAQVRTLKA